MNKHDKAVKHYRDIIRDLVNEVDTWNKTDLVEAVQETRQEELEELLLQSGGEQLLAEWDNLPQNLKTAKRPGSGPTPKFVGVIEANNKALGGKGNPYAHLTIDETQAVIGYRAVRGADGELDIIYGSHPLLGRDLDKEVGHIYNLLIQWGRRGGVWIDYKYTQKLGVGHGDYLGRGERR